MKSKILNHYDAFVAITLMLAFCVAAFVCFIAMTNVMSEVSDSLQNPLSSTDKYITSLAHK